MDLNHFLARHQTSLIRAREAVCTPSRLAYQALADEYESRVNTLYEEMGAAARLLPQVTS